MSEVSERYRVIADGFTARVEGVAPGRWSAPTPCSEWTARELVGHVIDTHRRVIARLDDTAPDVVALDDELPKQWLVASAAVLEALCDDTRASQVVNGMFGAQPFEDVVGRLVCADTLLHTWDLARATGQDERIDPVGVSKSIEFLFPLDEAIRRPGGFAAKIDPAPDADEQTRLLNFCGRVV